MTIWWYNANVSYIVSNEWIWIFHTVNLIQAFIQPIQTRFVTELSLFAHMSHINEFSHAVEQTVIQTYIAKKLTPIHDVCVCVEMNIENFAADIVRIESNLQWIWDKMLGNVKWHIHLHQILWHRVHLIKTMFVLIYVSCRSVILLQYFLILHNSRHPQILSFSSASHTIFLSRWYMISRTQNIKFVVEDKHDNLLHNFVFDFQCWEYRSSTISLSLVVVFVVVVAAAAAPSPGASLLYSN